MYMYLYMYMYVCIYIYIYIYRVDCWLLDWAFQNSRGQNVRPKLETLTGWELRTILQLVTLTSLISDLPKQDSTPKTLNPINPN